MSCVSGSPETQMAQGFEGVTDGFFICVSDVTPLCQERTVDFMNVYEWLGQIQKLDELINAKIAERDRYIAMAEDISAKPIDGMPFNNTGTVSQKMQNAVVNLVMVSHEIDRLVDQYVDLKREVVKVLEKLPAREYGVMHRQYIQGKTQEQIADEMGYCTTQIWRIKKNALKILEDAIECNAKT